MGLCGEVREEDEAGREGPVGHGFIKKSKGREPRCGRSIAYAVELQPMAQGDKGVEVSGLGSRFG